MKESEKRVEKIQFQTNSSRINSKEGRPKDSSVKNCYKSERINKVEMYYLNSKAVMVSGKGHDVLQQYLKWVNIK